MASRACWCGVQARVSGAGRRVAQTAMARARASMGRRATQGGVGRGGWGAGRGGARAEMASARASKERRATQGSVAGGAKWRGMGAAVRGLRLGGRLVPRARLAAVGGRLAGQPLHGVEDDGTV